MVLNLDKYLKKKIIVFIIITFQISFYITIFIFLNKVDSLLNYQLLDKSVLENYHASASFTLALEEETAIFKNFIREDYCKIRERIISMILATDMSSHFSDLAKLKGRLATSGS